jgi:DNA-binding NtrC family response regulator
VVSSDTIERRHLQAHPNTWHRLKKQRDEVIQGKTFSADRDKKGDARRVEPPVGLKAQQAEQERETLSAALADHGGNVTRAANSIGISRQLFSYKMKKHGIQRSRKKP